MTPEQIKTVLESGGRIEFKVWTFYATHYECCECDDGCSCGDGFSSLQDAINGVMLFAAGEEHLLKPIEKLNNTTKPL